MKRILPPFLIFILLISCNNKNKLNTDENVLAQQIKTEEQQKQEAEQAARENKTIIPDSITAGFRYQEDRSVDPQNPPVIIHISDTNKHVQEFKLSNISSSIKYVKLEALQDTLLLWTHTKLRDKTSSVISDDNHIIIQGLFGVTRFTMDGKFREVIWKNESGIKVEQNFVSWYPQQLFGVTIDNPVSLFNGSLYIRFQDGQKAQVQITNKKIQDDLVLNNPLNQNEFRKDTLIGDKLLTIQEEYVSRKYPLIYGLDKNCWAGIHNTWESANNGSLFVVFNSNGDTLCAISSPNQIQNWSKSLVRAGEPFTYYFKNQLTFLEQYTDTIFRFIPPNRMLPVYILDFGKDKVSFTEGLDPDSDLSQKLMLESIFETDKYIFIRYTRNNASPRNIDNKSVAFYNAIFDKTANKLYHLPGQSSTPEYLKNDVDGGISFWPEFVTPKGNMLMLLTGQEIKEYINSSDFKNGNLSEEQRQNQAKMASGLKNNDMVVMIVN